MRTGSSANINLIRRCEGEILNILGVIILDGAIRFNKLVYPPDTTMSTHREFTAFSEADQRYRQTGFKKLFLSHKTGDSEAEDLAKRLARRFNIAVYMAEWDTNVTNDSPSLPSYIKKK